jgi:glycosyltransferase involved in cell wall biosynthesis
MELIDFSRNEENFSGTKHIDSVLLFGDPHAVADAEITICIPTYKRPVLLKDAITSAINQSTTIPYKIIVVDNDPDFENKEVLNLIKSFNKTNMAYYKNKENLLLFGNLNRCIFLAKTPWASLLHDDDILLPGYISAISSILLKRGKKIDGLAVGFTNQDYPYTETAAFQKRSLYRFLKSIYQIYYLKKRMSAFITRVKEPIIIKIPLSANLFFGNIYGAPTCGMLFKRESFLDSGGFNQKYYPSADWFFNIFFSMHYNFYKYRKKLGIYRWMVNASLNENVIEDIKKKIKTGLFSLKAFNLSSRILMFFLKEDYNRIMNGNSRFGTPVDKSKWYRIVFSFYRYFFD